MLAFVPVAFDVYRPLKPRLRWAMACLVSFADHAGRCWPSCRTFAAFAGISKSAAGRHLAGLVEAGVVTRKRRPGRAAMNTRSTGDFCRVLRCPTFEKGVSHFRRDKKQIQGNRQRGRVRARDSLIEG